MKFHPLRHQPQLTSHVLLHSDLEPAIAVGHRRIKLSLCQI
jgi:hypothetical protein